MSHSFETSKKKKEKGIASVKTKLIILEKLHKGDL